MKRIIALMAMTIVCGLSAEVYAQNPEVMKRVMENMQTHTLTGQVMIVGEDG